MHATSSVRPCWHESKKAIWLAFWRNTTNRKADCLSIKARVSLIGKAIKPVVAYRWSRWPPQKLIAKELDGAQAKMALVAIKTPKLDTETLEGYCKRRARIARKTCRETGVWSKIWYDKALAWDAHVQRAPLSQNAQMLCWHDQKWLQPRRAQYATSTWSIAKPAFTLTAGRTNTRISSGKVEMRWQEGLDYARSMG